MNYANNVASAPAIVPIEELFGSPAQNDSNNTPSNTAALQTSKRQNWIQNTIQFYKNKKNMSSYCSQQLSRGKMFKKHLERRGASRNTWSCDYKVYLKWEKRDGKLKEIL